MMDLYVSDCDHCRPVPPPPPAAQLVAPAVRERRPPRPQPEVRPKASRRVTPFQSEQTIRRVVETIEAVRPEWSEWLLRDALKHAIKAGYAGTDKPDTFMAYAVAIAGKPRVNTPETMKWPEQWHWAAKQAEQFLARSTVWATPENAPGLAGDPVTRILAVDYNEPV